MRILDQFSNHTETPTGVFCKKVFANMKTPRTTASNHTVNRHETSRESQRGSSNYKIIIQSRRHQKRPSRDVPRERCSKNTQQSYRKTPMPKCFDIGNRHGCSSVNLLNIFRTSFPRNTSGQLLLQHEKR